MATQTEIIPLSSLEFIPYLNNHGYISDDLQGKIGVYAIFAEDKSLQYIGYSRDVFLSLKQHLIRQPDRCYWIKVQTIERPTRTILENIRTSWIEENSSLPPGNGEDQAKWTEPIDAKPTLTAAQIAEYQQSEERLKIKLLKKAARRVEAQIQQQLENRGVQMEIRFNPKLKEQGLLDLK